jgi:hypothetical protein
MSEPQDDSKPFWTSKSIWSGAIGLVATILTAAGVHVLDDPATQAEVVAGVTAVAAIVFRLVTKTPIK